MQFIAHDCYTLPETNWIIFRYKFDGFFNVVEHTQNKVKYLNFANYVV